MAGTIILNLHGLGDPAAAPRALEPGEAAYWVPASLLEEAAARAADAPPGRIAFTFDDGNISDLSIGAPILSARGLTARIFPLAGRLGRPGSLGAVELRELLAMGFSIGSHGHGHVDWRGLDEAGRARELAQAREAIAEAAGAPVSEAAIPFGLYDRRVLAALRAGGWGRVFTSDGGEAGAGWIAPRTSLRAGMTGADLDRLIVGRESPLRRLRRRAAMLKKRLL